MIRALIDARRATSAPHVPRVRPADVLDRVFSPDQCDWEYVAQVAAAADRRPIDDERNDP